MKAMIDDLAAFAATAGLLGLVWFTCTAMG